MDFSVIPCNLVYSTLFIDLVVYLGDHEYSTKSAILFEGEQTTVGAASSEAQSEHSNHTRGHEQRTLHQDKISNLIRALIEHQEIVINR